MRTRHRKEGRLLGAHCSVAGGFVNAARLGGQIGCTAIQIFTGSNRQWRARAVAREEAEAFRKEMARAGICAAFAHAIYLINLAAPDDAVWKKSLQAMAGELSRAELLGLPFVVVHPGSPKEKGRAWGIARAAEGIARAFDAAGEVCTRIALETTAGSGSTLGGRFEDLEEIIRRSGCGERLLVCFDTCHAFAAGYDIRSEEGYKKVWRSFERTLSLERLAAIHLNDSKGELASGVDRHADIGKGKIGLEGFRRLMRDPRWFSLPMVLETPKGDDPVASDRHNLRTLLGLG